MLSKFDSDHGTPERDTANSVTLQIDGMTITVPLGTSLMRAASGAGVKVPKLCATDSIEPFGSCRLWLVEIEGRKGYPASCTTICEDGGRARRQFQRALRARRRYRAIRSEHTTRNGGDGESRVLSRSGFVLK